MIVIEMQKSQEISFDWEKDDERLQWVIKISTYEKI